MAEESDGIEEALEGSVRLAVMAGARLGSEIARAREDRLRAQLRIDEREAERLADRFEAERRAAVIELSRVHRPDWWDRADPARISRLYATARAWESEPAAVAAEQRMREEIQTRYGVDVDTFLARTAAERARRAAEPTFSVWEFRNEAECTRRISKAAALRMVENMPATADVTRAAEGGPDLQAWKGRDVDVDEAIARRFPHAMTQEELDRTAARRQAQEEAEAVLLLTEADRDAGAVYDSTDRRSADADAMTVAGISPDIVQSRMHADTAAGTPATLATTRARSGRAPRARKATRRGVAVERAGIER